jgi:hypothetical protein
MKKILALLCIVWLSASCVPVAVGVAAGKIERNRRIQASYEKYVANTRETNRERQRKGLEPVPIMTFDEWQRFSKTGTDQEPK